MSDLIERQKAINAMAQALWLYPNEYYSNLSAYAFAKGLAENGLRSVPSAQPESHWIPVSERLPEKYGQYLVTFIPSAGTPWTYVLIARYSDLDLMGIAKPSFHIWNVGKNNFTNITEITEQVVAWMPLPEPYRVERITDE